MEGCTPEENVNNSNANWKNLIVSKNNLNFHGMC